MASLTALSIQVQSTIGTLGLGLFTWNPVCSDFFLKIATNDSFAQTFLFFFSFGQIRVTTFSHFNTDHSRSISSVVFIVMSVVIGLLLHFGYTRIPNDWTSSTLLRAFINAIFFDIILVIVSPILLLYSSNELRTSIKNKVILPGSCCK